MITVDKWFRINRADKGLCNYWPELSAGTVFKVRELAKECEDDIEPDTGIIEIELSDGKIINIYDKPITYWCLWNTESVENGEIAAVIIGDEATLKRVNYYPDKNLLILHAENPSYKDLIYTDAELSQIVILGKAVAFQSLVK